MTPADTVPTSPIDPVTLEIMRNRWKGIAEEMCAALVRTSYSTNIKDRRDCSAAIALPSGMSLSNKGPLNASFSVADDGGFVDFLFRTISSGAQISEITNGVGATGPLARKLDVAFLQEGSKSVLAFFDDGRGDSDFDDMVIRISVVPLPAGGLLLLTALGGFAAMRRRKTV